MTKKVARDFPKTSKVLIVLSILGAVALVCALGLFGFSFYHHYTDTTKTVEQATSSASKNEAEQAASYAASQESSEQAASVSSSLSASRSASRESYEASTSASKAAKALRKAQANADASTTSTTKSATTSTTDKAAQVRNLTTAQVEDWVFAYLTVDTTKFTKADYHFDMSKDAQDQLKIQVTENHSSANMQAADADPATAPTVGNFLINAKGQLIAIDQVTGQEVVVADGYSH
jgi:cytoskeletal protein RodZ